MEFQGDDKETHIYKTVDGLALRADVYRSHPSEPRPVLLWIHGGALIMGGRGDLRPYQRDLYLAAGFTVVSVDYRLAPETKLPAIIEDLRDAYAWILAEGPTLFGLDRERIAVAGHSAGGYLTLMAGFCVAPRPKAVVAFYGYGDIVGDWYTKPDPFYSRMPAVSDDEARRAVGASTLIEGPGAIRFPFYLHCRQTGRWPLEVSGHDPDAEAAWFGGYCPLQNVTADYPPALLIHGVPDTDVPYAQSVAMAGQFAAHGVAHEFITLPTLGHAFDYEDGAAQSGDVTAVFDQVVAFLRKHT